MRRALSMHNTLKVSKFLTSYSRLAIITLNSRRFCQSIAESPVPVKNEVPVDANNNLAKNDTIIERTTIKNILLTGSEGDIVKVQGWVRAYRKQKKFTFFDVYDGSSVHHLPVVCPTDNIPYTLPLGVHCSVEVIGEIKKSPRNSSLLELVPTQPVVVIGPCNQQRYPLSGKAAYEIEYIRQYLHLRPKTNQFSSLFRLRSIASRAVSDYFHENDFIQVHTPILTSNDCEGAGEVFLVRPANEELMADSLIVSTPFSASNPRPTNPVKINGVQSHDHEDVPDDGQKYTHTHNCTECGKQFDHTHSRKSPEVSQTYDNHYCEEHKHLRKEHPTGSKTIPPQKHSIEEVFFNRKVFLTVSSQLHLEAFANGLDKVWTSSPVFRCENQRSTRHLSEFYMVEAEFAFASRIEQLLQVMENLVKFVVQRVVYDNSVEWNSFTLSTLGIPKVANSSAEHNRHSKLLMDRIVKRPFTVMTYQEACLLLESKANSVVNPKQGLNREQELILVEKLNDFVPVFVINWPSNIKPFYMRRLPDDESLCSAVDLLVPSVGELCGGSLRENDLSILQSRLQSVDPSGKLQQSLDWYFDLRRFGSVPTAGFGLGFDRLMQLILGKNSIKDVNPVPRWVRNCQM